MLRRTGAHSVTVLVQQPEPGKTHAQLQSCVRLSLTATEGALHPSMLWSWCMKLLGRHLLQDSRQHRHVLAWVCYAREVYKAIAVLLTTSEVRLRDS